MERSVLLVINMMHDRHRQDLTYAVEGRRVEVAGPERKRGNGGFCTAHDSADQFVNYTSTVLGRLRSFHFVPCFSQQIPLIMKFLIDSDQQIERLLDAIGNRCSSTRMTSTGEMTRAGLLRGSSKRY